MPSDDDFPINNQSIPFEDALDVYLNVPTAGTSFTFENALVHVGTAPFLARLDCNISKQDRMFRVKTQGALPAHSNDDDAIKERVELRTEILDMLGAKHSELNQQSPDPTVES